MPIDLDRLVPGGALSGPVFARLARAAATVEPVRVGEEFGPFRVVRELGRGGMAVVWLAERVDGAYEQQVALKLVATRGDSGTAATLFRQERQILARLTHPHIARLLDGGSRADGTLWFAMELVEGEPIDRWCAARRLSARARVALFEQVCHALAFAHARLLIHRDLKPSNILVGADGQAKLLDFGIAALLDEAGVAEHAPRALTPGYASPEQVRGEVATTASDIWQLGRLLEALFEEHDAPARDADLAAIVAHAMADDPAARYGTVAELLADLANWREARPVRAREGGLAYRLGRLLARRRWVALSAAAVGIAFAVTVAAFMVGLARERDAAEREAERTQATLGFLTGLFAVADPGVNRGERLSANEILERGERQLETELAAQPALRAELLETIGAVHLALGQSARARPLLATAAELSRGRADVSAVELARRLRALARVSWRLGQLQPALDLAEEGLRVLGAAPAADELRGGLLNTRAIVTLLLGDAASAERLQREALAAIEATLGAQSMLAGYGWNNLGRALEQQDRVPEAARAYERALAILRDAIGPDHPDTLDIGTTWARQLGFIGRRDDALRELQRVQGELARVLGAQDFRYGYALMSEAQVRLHAGEVEAALPLAARAVGIYRASAGEQNLYTAVAWETLGQAHMAHADTAAAQAAFRAALSIRERELAPGHVDLAMSRYYLGVALCRGGDAAGGRALLERARAVAPGIDGMPAALASCTGG